MGKLKKKGETGTAANYISITQAVKKLQVSLSDFRRLCILKGIYPREPKVRGKLRRAGRSVKPGQAFYHVKDIRILLHEPLVDKFRELRAFAKKVKKLMGRAEWARLKNLECPKYTLDHLVKERYPTFLDALEDVDDALSMISLFSQLPKEVSCSSTHGLKPFEEKRADMTRSCFSIMRHWEAWVMQSGSLRKAFVSIKGIYYQADVMGKQVTWLTPLEFAQSIPNDVDFRVMSTFLEFYQTLLKFVNFRLFSSIGWAFPFNSSALDAFQAGSERPVITSELPETVEIAKEGQLMKDTKVFLSREVPRRAISFICQSMGCKEIGWASLDGSSPFGEDEESITHQIIDRPVLSSIVPGRVYVQPQWLFDSLNAGKLLDPVEYKVGANLPPHLSPFVQEEEEEEEEDKVEQSEPVAEKTENEMAIQEQKKLSLALLSKKKRKLYERIQRERDAKSEEKKKLAQKKAALKANN